MQRRRGCGDRSARRCGLRCRVGAALALTLAWASGVSTVVAARIGEQVRASEDLARDIALLDGGHGGALVTQWQDLVALMLEFRGQTLLAILVLPPLACLAAVVAWQAWRRCAPRVTVRPAYSAAVREGEPSRFM